MTTVVAEKATIADICQTLKKPKGYVRRVLENMINYEKKHGTAFVRIGTTGHGLPPHYRVQRMHSDRERRKQSDSAELLGHVEDDKSGYFTAFNCTSHKRLAWGPKELQRQSWSTRAMTVEEVRSLMGELNGPRRPT